MILTRGLGWFVVVLIKQWFGLCLIESVREELVSSFIVNIGKFVVLENPFTPKLYLLKLPCIKNTLFALGG